MAAEICCMMPNDNSSIVYDSFYFLIYCFVNLSVELQALAEELVLGDDDSDALVPCQRLLSLWGQNRFLPHFIKASNSGIKVLQRLPALLFSIILFKIHIHPYGRHINFLLPNTYSQLF